MEKARITYQNHTPKVHEESFIFENVSLIGQVEIAKDCSIWFGSVLRGDVGAIKVGEGSNIQDLSLVHVDYHKGVEIGARVTIGHKCIIHACSIEDEVLVGMGSTIMDGARIGAQSIVGAGSLITKNKTFPPKSLIMGNPARFIRELSEEEIHSIKLSAKQYIELAKSYEL